MTERAIITTTAKDSVENRGERYDRRQALEALLNVAERPHVTVREVASVLGQLHDLSESVRQRANASARGLPKQIVSLEHAVVYLGLAEIRRMVREQVASWDVASRPTSAEAAAEMSTSPWSGYRESA